MNRSAVLHIPMSQYAYGTDEEHIVIRLRAGRGDLTECILHYVGMFCRFGSVEEMRPVRASVWMKVEWTRPSAASAFSRPST